MTKFEISKLLPPKTSNTHAQLSLRVPAEIIDGLDEVAGDVGYTRSQVVVRFLRWAIEQYKEEKAEGRRGAFSGKATKSPKKP
jgi:metal-responsive CopG/Arc/MetJ family transcriptional regulator